VSLNDYDRPDTLPPEQLTVHLPFRAHRPARVGWFVLGSGPSPAAVLAAVEGSLSVQEVALSRWRAWVRHNACWVRFFIPHVYFQSLIIIYMLSNILVKRAGGGGGQHVGEEVALSRVARLARHKACWVHTTSTIMRISAFTAFCLSAAFACQRLLPANGFGKDSVPHASLMPSCTSQVTGGAWLDRQLELTAH